MILEIYRDVHYYHNFILEHFQHPQEKSSAIYSLSPFLSPLQSIFCLHDLPFLNISYEWDYRNVKWEDTLYTLYVIYNV